MNRYTALNVVSFILVAIALVGSVFLAPNSWQETATATKTHVVSSYIETADGRMYGNYCSQDGTVLDGGTICTAETEEVAYSLGDRVFAVFGDLMLIWVPAVLLIVGLRAYFLRTTVTVHHG